MNNHTHVRAIELFAGIGGFAQATFDWPVDIVNALDMSSHVLEMYAYNFNHPTIQQNLEVLSARQLQSYDAQLWWMSPPCQPYTVRGLQKDLEDHRAKSLLHVMTLLSSDPPAMLAMENVEGFASSQARTRLLDVLEAKGFDVRESVLCPTALGIPARRARYYLVASRDGLLDVDDAQTHTPRAVRSFMEDEVDESFYIKPAILEKHGRGMRFVDNPDDPDDHANCFTSAYGKTYRFAGSYVRDEQGRARYFTPRELLRFLGFPDTYQWPTHLSRKQLYKYIGNSLSIYSLQHVLRPLGLG